MRSVPDWPPKADSGGGTPLRAGDVVRVRTATAEMTLLLTAVEPDALVGRGDGTLPPVRVPFDDIVGLERQAVDGRKTGWLLAGVGIGLLALLAWALGHAAFMPGP